MISGNINEWKEFWNNVILENQPTELYDEDDFIDIIIDNGYHSNKKSIFICNSVVRSCNECPNKKINTGFYCGLQYTEEQDAIDNGSYWENENEMPEIPNNCPLI